MRIRKEEVELMRFFPTAIRVQDRRCLVAGAGVTGLSRTRSLLEAGARVTVVSPTFLPEFDQLEGLERRQRHFEVADLEGVFLAVAATNDTQINRAFAEACRARGVLCNVVDAPELCDFIMPAVVRRSGLTVAITTNGASPALSKRLRRDIERLLPEGYDRYTAFLKMARGRAMSSSLANADDRRRIATTLASTAGYERYASMDATDLERWLQDILARRNLYGKVYLVGAGPGDPGLLTVKGRECLEQADAILYDRLVNTRLLDHAPQAEKVSVGKTPGGKKQSQQMINRLLVDYARRFPCVVRLKGGDPFVFGRGAEEALALAQHGIPFEIVPGVTAGTAAPAYAGIPVTHRGLAASCTFIAGCQADGPLSPAPDLGRLGLDGTLVFYMCVKSLPRIVQALLRQGRSSGTMTAVIEWGTWQKQRVIRAPLGEIVAQSRAAELESPAVLVVGDVVSLSDTLSWFSDPVLPLRVHADEEEKVSREFGAGTAMART